MTPETQLAFKNQPRDITGTAEVNNFELQPYQCDAIAATMSSLGRARSAINRLMQGRAAVLATFRQGRTLRVFGVPERDLITFKRRRILDRPFSRNPRTNRRFRPDELAMKSLTFRHRFRSGSLCEMTFHLPPTGCLAAPATFGTAQCLNSAAKGLPGNCPASAPSPNTLEPQLSTEHTYGPVRRRSGAATQAESQNACPSLKSLTTELSSLPRSMSTITEIHGPR